MQRTPLICARVGNTLANETDKQTKFNAETTIGLLKYAYFREKMGGRNYCQKTMIEVIRECNEVAGKMFDKFYGHNLAIMRSFDFKESEKYYGHMLVSEGEEYSVTRVGIEVPVYFFNKKLIPELTVDGLHEWLNILCCFLDLEGMVKHVKGPAQTRQYDLLAKRRALHVGRIDQTIDRLSRMAIVEKEDVF